MSLVLRALLWAASLLPAEGVKAPAINYIWLQSGHGPGKVWQPSPYCPHEGDIVFFDFPKPIWRLMYRLAGSGPPTHCGIVFRMPDSQLMILEAGSLKPQNVDLVEVQRRLQTYDGTVWVRLIQCPLTPRQSRCLTEFALRQANKPFAKLRIGMEAFTHRNLSVTRYLLCGPPSTDRVSYFCSELVLAACIEVGLLYPNVLGPRMPDPRDMYFDSRPNLSPCWSPPWLITPKPCIDRPTCLRGHRG